jgi:VWFA-related protein
MSARTVSAPLIALIAVSLSSWAQNTPPASTPSAVSSQPATKQSGPGSVPTVKASAELVIVDVVVTDSGKKPVHGLTAADFKLTESNVPQVIKHFEEHTALTSADAAKFASMPKLPPGIFTNYTPAPVSGAVNLVLLDALNTPMRDQAFVRKQLLAYLKSTPPGTRIAIFGLTTHLILLQGFTSDPDALRAVLDKGRAKGSPLLDDQVGGGGIQNNQTDDLEDSGADPTVIANMRQFDAETQSFQLQLRAKYTLDAMNQIARYLSAIPGRKNLIWFSGSFPIDILPDTSGTQTDPFAAVASSEDEFRDTVSLLARSQVAVYPIDARGLMTSPVFDASTSRNYGGATGRARMMQDNSKFFNDTAEEHGTMLAMADATGGRAFVNTNGLTQAVASAIEEGSNFYTLTYTPTNSEHDGKLRKIKIQLSRPGVELSYRKGYYADDPDKVDKTVTKLDAAVTGAPALTSQDTLRLAMTRGAPTPAEILIKVGVMTLTPASQTEDKVAPGNLPAAKAKGPYRRYSVNYAIEPRDLTFVRAPDGKVHGDFDLVIFVFNPDGELVNALQNTIHFAGSLDELRQMVAHGLLCHEEISAPAKGEYFLRIAVHDLHRDHYGAVEVATSSVRDVVPQMPPATAAPVATPAPMAK